jgi:hypothetical protein
MLDDVEGALDRTSGGRSGDEGRGDRAADGRSGTRRKVDIFFTVVAVLLFDCLAGGKEEEEEDGEATGEVDSTSLFFPLLLEGSLVTAVSGSVGGAS